MKFKNLKELEKGYMLGLNYIKHSNNAKSLENQYIKRLKERGFKLYLLTNISEDSYNYINDVIDINKIFEGGIYSYQEHLVKPNPDIYKLIIDRFKLNKEETIFFDDKEVNITAAYNEGIKGIVFNSIDDIKNNLN